MKSEELATAMNVLHLYPENDQLIAQHVSMLQVHDISSLGEGYFSSLLEGSGEASSREGSGEALPSIVHVHGCWNRSIVRQALHLHRKGARIVLSPHGHLEPWIISQQRMTEKTAKILLWQKRLVQHAYALIAHGKMETQALQTLAWNPRIETINNAVISNTITPEAMARQTANIYQKVMDSNTIEHMDEPVCRLMSILLKAGITGDRRWVEASPVPSQGGEMAAHPYSDTITPPFEGSAEAWRHLLLYADHENIRNVIDKGIHVMGMEVPDIHLPQSTHPSPITTHQIPAYFPTNYRKPSLSTTDAVEIAEDAQHHQLTMYHLVALAHALRRPDADDERIAEALAGKRLTRYFQRLLQILQEQLLQEEGFLPLPPIDDRKTQQLRRELANHLKI